MRLNRQLTRFQRKRLALFFMLFCFVALTRAQQVYTLKASRQPQPVNRNFVYFIDESNTLIADNVLQKGNFKPSEEDIPNLNVIKGTSWSALKVTCTEPGDYYLSLEPLAANIASQE